MFPFRKPPTKLELAKKGVSEAAHTLMDALPVAQIEEKFDDLKKSAVLAAAAAAVAAHHAGEAASHKIGEVKEVASHLGENFSGAAQTAASVAAAKASAATQSARETAQATRENLGERAKSVGGLKDRLTQDFAVGSKEAQNAKNVAQKAAEREAAAVKARAVAVEAKKQAKLLDKAADHAQKEADATASQAKDAAARAARELKEQAEAKAAEEKARLEAEKLAAEKIEAEKLEAEEMKAQVQANAEKAEAQALSAKAAKKAAKAQGKARAETDDDWEERAIVLHRESEGNELAEVQIAESGSKIGWVLVGLAVGGALALLLAPTTGRRSRAAIKDRLGKVGDGLVDAQTATSDKVVDIAQRVEGLASKVEAKLAADGESDDDITISDRVRSMLGHHEVAKHLVERLNIDTAAGVVTLRGPMTDHTTEAALVTAIQTVPGVKQVVVDFLTDEAPEASNTAN